MTTREQLLHMCRHVPPRSTSVTPAGSEKARCRRRREVAATERAVPPRVAPQPTFRSRGRPGSVLDRFVPRILLASTPRAAMLQPQVHMVREA